MKEPGIKEKDLEKLREILRIIASGHNAEVKKDPSGEMAVYEVFIKKSSV